MQPTGREGEGVVWAAPSDGAVENGTVTPLVDTLARAGVETAWLSNPSKRWIYHDAMTGGPRVLPAERFDDALLPRLRSELLRPGGDRFIVLDTYAGHFPYCGNVPGERSVRWGDWMSRLSREAIWGEHRANRAVLDCYDSAVHYVAGTIREALLALDEASAPAVFIYVPDRGEDVWAQADPHRDTLSVREIEIPLLLYVNRAFAARYPADLAHARRNRGHRYASTWLYHTILGAFGVTGAGDPAAFDRRLSLLDSSFAPPSLRSIGMTGGEIALGAAEVPAGPAAREPRGRLCVHRANSLFKYLEAKALYECAEVDVVFEGEGSGRRPFVFHPPEMSNAGLDLYELLEHAGVPRFGLWLDIKNLTDREVPALLAGLSAAIPPRVRARVLIESGNLVLARAPVAAAIGDSGYVLSILCPTTPAPLPRSSTVSPGCRWLRSCGFPTPAKDAIAPAGARSSHSAS